MPLPLSGAQVRKDFHQRLLLHAANRPRRETQLPFAILVEQSILDHLLQQLGFFRILAVAQHLLDRLQGLLAVLKDELHELVEIEEAIGCGKFLAVVFAVEVLHRAAILASAEE